MAFATRVLGLVGAALVLYELFKPDPDQAAAAAAKRAAARERLICDLSEITPNYLYPLDQTVDVTGEGHTINRIDELVPWRMIPAAATSPP
jgi:hypothetical protein